MLPFRFWMFVLLDKVFSGCAFLLGDSGGWVFECASFFSDD